MYSKIMIWANVTKFGQNFIAPPKFFGLVRVWSSSSSFEGYPLQSDTNRTGAEGLSFYYPRLLYCLNKMLAVVLLSQHRVSSSKTVRPRPACGVRCIEHAVRTWSAICSEVPHMQFGEGVNGIAQHQLRCNSIG